MKAALALLAAVAAAGLVCMAVMPTEPGHAELMYGRGNNWGGFLSSDYGEGFPNKRPANALTKQDLALLKVAHDEELKESKDGMQAKKHDMDALSAREKRLAKAKKEQAALHSQQLASVPAAPFKKAPARGKNELTHKDEKLLSIATQEMHKETKSAILDKKADMEAEEVREQQKKAAAKKAKEAKAKAAKLQAAHARHAGHKAAKVAAAAGGVDKSWGGFLPSMHARAEGSLDPKALALLKKAEASQESDQKQGEAARARDRSALKTRDGANEIDTGKVHQEAQSEFAHIEQRASIGLNTATAVDDSEERQAWGGV